MNTGCTLWVLPGHDTYQGQPTTWGGEREREAKMESEQAGHVGLPVDDDDDDDDDDDGMALFGITQFG